jgi:hypothetical protein
MPSLNKRTIAIMQPTYMPWVGLFDLYDQVDVMVWYDDVQIVKRSWDCRNRIKTLKGEQLLTVPVFKNKNRDNTKFNNASINYEQNWSRKHLQALRLNYKKSLNFEVMDSWLTPILQEKYETIADLNISIIERFANYLNIETPSVRSSELNNISGSKDERLANICKRLEATDYLSPLGSGAYMEEETPGGKVAKEGVTVKYQNYVHPIYKQQHGEFISHLSILDLMYNYKFGECLDIIRSGRKESIPCEKYHLHMEKLNK